ncbi:MAG: hypothetical protein GXO88_01670 [Chlorobi bacterium]|nr:hypothetical protein [Chlorobiota bacterium]
MNWYIRILVCMLFLGLTACSPIIQGLYGIKNPKRIDYRTIDGYAEKYNIPLTDNYKIDSSYMGFLSSLDTMKYKNQLKNHYQPLQALYYNGNGQLESFQINCYSGGFPNLNWGRDSIMMSFPPKQQAPIDSILPLNLQLEYIQALPKTKSFSIRDYDYVIIVFWNRFMGRQSKRLIRTIQENRKLAKDTRVKIIYVNTDNIFVDYVN